MLSGYVTFASTSGLTVTARISVSLISVDQARRNLDLEIPDGTILEQTARETRALWAANLHMIQTEGAKDEDLEVFYTAFFHTLQVRYTYRISL
jgi:putative alpha-1,2-mannosidase